MFVCLVRDSLSPSKPGVLEAVARACSPRVESYGPDAVICDARGLTRVIGTAPIIAEEMRRMAWHREVGVRVAIAGSQVAAWLLAHAKPGTTIVAPGEERRRLERLPISVLRTLPEFESAGAKAPASMSKRRNRPTSQRPHVSTSQRPNAPTSQRSNVDDVFLTFDRWGLATLGDLARLSRADLLSRLGPVGARFHQAACGEDAAPMVPQDEVRRFVERIELEWPVEGLEPLSFVLARLCDGLSLSLERADRGAVSLTTRLQLVDRTTHTRTLTLPAPMRDARTLRTLILLDLESHPASAGIDVVEVECEVTPGRIVQGSLLAYAVPTPEALSTLLARLRALAGESRVGAPAVVDTHNPRVSSMNTFAPSTAHRALSTEHAAVRTEHKAPRTEHLAPSTALRRFRPPLPARVVVDKGMPMSVAVSAMRSVPILDRAGPWRTSGHWWTSDADTWDRDEWDVALETGVIYRLARDRQTDRWEVEGEMD